MRGRIHTDSLAHEFRLLRNRIEAEIHAPAVVLVTSATDRDGAAVTAFGLAESLSKTHQRTALVTTATAATSNPQVIPPGGPVMRRRAGDRLETGLAKPAGSVSVVAISPERLATISRTNVAALVDELRAEHDYIVVDGGNLPNNSFALLLAGSVDAILLTFLTGRQQSALDRSMLDTLERTEAKMLGVVMTDQAAIDQFAERDVLAEQREAITMKRAGHPFVNRLEGALNRALGKSF